MPVYQAESVLRELHKRIGETLTSASIDWELILVDDGSSDHSAAVQHAIADHDPRVTSVELATNVGQHLAVVAGLTVAKGRWIAVMDCDLEDPPEALPSLFDAARSGENEAAIALRAESKRPAVRGVGSRMFNALLRFLSRAPADARIGNFRVFSRRIRDIIVAHQSRDFLMQSFFASLGLPTAYVEVVRESPTCRASTYSFLSLSSLAYRSLVGSSESPLIIGVVAGVLIGMGAILAAAFMIVLRLTGYVGVPGWASVSVLVLVMASVQLCYSGLVGLYVARIARESRAQPLFVIRRVVSRNQSGCS